MRSNDLCLLSLLNQNQISELCALRRNSTTLGSCDEGRRNVELADSRCVHVIVEIYVVIVLRQGCARRVIQIGGKSNFRTSLDGALKQTCEHPWRLETSEPPLTSRNQHQ